MTLLAFLKLYETKPHKIILTPYIYNGRVTLIEVSFNKKNYNRGNFAGIIDLVYEESFHAAWVVGEWSDFYRGSFTIKINVASANYNPDRIIFMLKKLTETTFPNLEKTE